MAGLTFAPLALARPASRGLLFHESQKNFVSGGTHNWFPNCSCVKSHSKSQTPTSTFWALAAQPGAKDRVIGGHNGHRTFYRPRHCGLRHTH